MQIQGAATSSFGNHFICPSCNSYAMVALLGMQGSPPSHLQDPCKAESTNSAKNIPQHKMYRNCLTLLLPLMNVFGPFLLAMLQQDGRSNRTPVIGPAARCIAGKRFPCRLVIWHATSVSFLHGLCGFKWGPLKQSHNSKIAVEGCWRDQIWDFDFACYWDATSLKTIYPVGFLNFYEPHTYCKAPNLSTVFQLFLFQNQFVYQKNFRMYRLDQSCATLSYICTMCIYIYIYIYLMICVYYNIYIYI